MQSGPCRSLPSGSERNVVGHFGECRWQGIFVLVLCLGGGGGGGCNGLSVPGHGLGLRSHFLPVW